VHAILGRWRRGRAGRKLDAAEHDVSSNA
jgi:hypothetical protein